MKAVKVNGDGQLSRDMALIDVPMPDLTRHSVRIRTTHVGVNRPDILQRRGLYPPPANASPIMGLEVAGIIEAVGEDVTAWCVGDAVCALTNGGGYAQFVTVDARHVLPIPKGLSAIEAAALPEGVITVYANLIEGGQLKPNETVLVHGANSGIGAMTIMMAKAWGAKVIATARGADKCAFGATVGADHVIDTKAEDFVGALKELGGADVILDILGGEVTAKNILCLKPKGRLVQVGVQLGGEVTVDLRRIMQKQAVVTGSMLRPRSDDEKARLVAAVRHNIWPMIEGGRIKSLVDKVFDFNDVAAAHDYLETGQNLGKVVLKV